MTHNILHLFVLSSITAGSCSKPENFHNQQQRSCLLQVHQDSRIAEHAPRSRAALVEQIRLHTVGRFTPAHGNGGNLEASLEGVCAEDGYMPSSLEMDFKTNVLDWTKDESSLCEHLDAGSWIEDNVEGTLSSGTEVFSRLCKKGEAPQLLEPLAGILRDPRVICQPFNENHFFGIDWLVLADKGSAKQAGKRILYDAGGTRFMDAMQFFTRHYEKRGLELDKIFVWEAEHQGTEAYWSDTPPEVRQKWEPRLTFNDGIPVSADPESVNNPVYRIHAECRPEDFCAFKLDIDTPSVELPLIEQILASSSVAAVLDEFFFEHHVTGLMEDWGWDKDVNGTFADSYKMFTQLRKMGVRAHSWI